MTTPAVIAAQQSLTPGARIELFILDLNPIGVVATYYFTTSDYPDGSQLSFGGNLYTQVAITIAGVDRTADGSTPTPKVTLPNYNKFASGLVVQYGDLVGASLTRIITFSQFLDGQPLADSNAVLAKDVFTIEQKLNLNNAFAEFALRVPGDSANRYLPGRMAFKNICMWRYRTWNGSAFVYSSIRPCPYVGVGVFDALGNVATNATDVCSHDVVGCNLRFPAPAVKPMGAFPGLNRVKAQ